MNDFKRKYMSGLEYNYPEDHPHHSGHWTDCAFDDVLLECWDTYDNSSCWIFRNKQTKEVVPIQEVAQVLGVTLDTPKGLVEHNTGALRESKEGRGRPDLLLSGFPRALMALSKHMDCPLGRDRNWEKGLPESSLICSQFRHLLAYTSGVSEDAPEYNLVANVWNAMVLLEEYLRVQDGAMGGDVLDVEKE